MYRLLPFAFLLAFASIFGIAWVVVSFDPDKAPFYIFALFVLLVFIACFCLLGLILYFIRTRFYKRYSGNWYFKTSFKMAFFIALFVTIAVILAILQLITTFNVILTIIVVSLLAIYTYIGRRIRR